MHSSPPSAPHRPRSSRAETRCTTEETQLTSRPPTLSITVRPTAPLRRSSSNDQLSRILTYYQASIRLLMTLLTVREAIISHVKASRAAIVLRARRPARAMSLQHVVPKHFLLNMAWQAGTINDRPGSPS